MIALLGLEPTLPRELVALCRPRRRTPHLVGWH